LTATRRRYRPTGKWLATVEWKDEQADVSMPMRSIWNNCRAWIEGVLLLHGEHVARITIEPDREAGQK